MANVKNETTIREAENNVVIEGILAENNLEKFSSDNGEGIRGDLVIKTGEFSFHPVKFLVSKYKADKSENGSYKKIEEAMELVGIANVQDEDEADKISITSGKIGLEEYYQKDQLRAFNKVSSNFIKKINPSDIFNPRAEFRVEFYLHSIVEEIKDDEATGRVFLKALIPMYGGKIIPFTFVVSDNDIISFLDSSVSKGDTLKVYGEVVNTVMTQEIEEKVHVGKPVKTIKKTTVREFEITSMELPYDEDNLKKYTKDEIKAASAAREIYLQGLKKKSEDKESGKGSKGVVGKGSAGAKTASKPVTSAKPATQAKPAQKSALVSKPADAEDEEEELPF
jgi:hypothetical protein